MVEQPSLPDFSAVPAQSYPEVIQMKAERFAFKFAVVATNASVRLKN